MLPNNTESLIQFILNVVCLWSIIWGYSWLLKKTRKTQGIDTKLKC